MSKEMLINVSEGEECRIAIVEDGRLEELYIERTSSTSHVGNIYKGKVTNVEASIQAAFIDFGLGRNGFLHVSDLLPDYFGKKGEDVEEFVGKKMARRDRPPIQRCLRRGDEIIVQVIKEGIGTKGPTLSSYLSISGKMLVMMPGVAGRGVSRKIEDEQERRRLKQILVSLRPPEDCGFIIRTEATGKGKADIERDLKYLSRLWEQMKKRRDSTKGAIELYTEGDLVTRTIRDVFNADVDRLIVDNEEVADRVREVIRLTSPRASDKVEAYTDPIPLFHKYGIERDVELMYSRHVPLPSGGSLVIDSTEAVVAIDVNSGKFREHSDAETTAFRTDMEAADEICRQLKLRDLGGVIICDFIDLRFERNRRDLEQRIVDNFKKDRAKTKVLRMSQFGIIEITRQRMRPSLKRSVYLDCPHCKGAGLVKSPESMSLDVMRRMAIALNDPKVIRAELGVCADVAHYLNNRKRRQLADLEDRTNKEVTIKVEPNLGIDAMRLNLYDNRDGIVLLSELSEALEMHPHTSQLSVRQPGRTGDRKPVGDGKPPVDARRDDSRRDSKRDVQQDRFDLEADENYDRPPTSGRNREGSRKDEGRRDEGRREPPRRDDEPRDGGRRSDSRRAPDEPRRDDRPVRSRQTSARRDEPNGKPDRSGDHRGAQNAPRDIRAERKDRGGRDDQGRSSSGNRDGRRNDPRDARQPDRATPVGRKADEEFDEDELPEQNAAGDQALADNDETEEFGEPGEGGRRRRRRRRRRGRGRGRNEAPLAGDAAGENAQASPASGSSGSADEFDSTEDEPTDDAFDVGGPEGMASDEEIRHEEETLSSLAAENPSSVADSDAPELDDDSDLFEPVSNEPSDDELGPAPTEADDQSDESAAEEPESDDQTDDEAHEPVDAESAVPAASEEPVESHDRESEKELAGEPESTGELEQEESDEAKPKRGAKKRGGKAAAAPKGAKSAKAPKGRTAKAEKAPATKASGKAEKAAKAPKGRSRKKTDGEADAAKSASGESSEDSPKSTSRRAKRADQHLVVEAEAETETHFAEPPRRPRSYRDLDSIPDDFD